jgi:hypothetical protein
VREAMMATTAATPARSPAAAHHGNGLSMG